MSIQAGLLAALKALRAAVEEERLEASPSVDRLSKIESRLVELAFQVLSAIETGEVTETRALCAEVRLVRQEIATVFSSIP